MNTSDILGLIGLILGIWGIALAIKKKYPGKILFAEDNAVGLFNSIVRNFPEIAIKYDDRPITEQMAYIRAYFINTGSVDLSTKGNSSKLQINLPQEFKWLNSKITNVSPGVICTLTTSDNDLSFDFDLLRRNEFIQFEALLEIKDTKAPASSLRKSINFNHRIPNTAKVEYKKYLNDEQIASKRKEFKQNLIFATIFFIILVGGILYESISRSAEIRYSIPTNNKVYNVEVSLDGSDKVKLEDDEHHFKKIIPISEYNKIPNVHLFAKERTLWTRFKSSAYLLIYILLYGYITITEFRLLYINKKIKRAIGENQ